MGRAETLAIFSPIQCGASQEEAGGHGGCRLAKDQRMEP
jgi:hypothetical protein